MIKAAKFGGSSLADAECIKNAVKIIKSDETRRFVVVSAPGKRFEGDQKITDLLYCCVGCRGACGAAFKIVEQRLLQITETLKINLDIKTEIDKIKENIASGADEDYIASRGEYLTAKILSKVLGYEFVDASELIRFRNNVFDAQLTKKTIIKRLSGVEYAVIPGFYGSKVEDGTIKTFSRGGSDYSGAIIADAVGASLYENWTDVDGFMAIDPSIIKNPIKINELSYDELYRLARGGAKVLHPCSVLPLKRSKIKINIRNSFNLKSEGTIIGASCINRQTELAGISVKNDCKVLLIEHNSAQNDVVIKRLYNILNSVGGQIKHMTASVGSVNILLKEPITEQGLKYMQATLSEMRISLIEMNLISLVGYRKKGIIKRINKTLFGHSDIRIFGRGQDTVVGVKKGEDLEPILTKLYNEFFKD